MVALLTLEKCTGCVFAVIDTIALQYSGTASPTAQETTSLVITFSRHFPLQHAAQDIRIHWIHVCSKARLTWQHCPGTWRSSVEWQKRLGTPSLTTSERWDPCQSFFPSSCHIFKGQPLFLSLHRIQMVQPGISGWQDCVWKRTQRKPRACYKVFLNTAAAL